MSTDATTNAPDGEAPEPSPCQACRGVGTVISNLGGTPSTVTCPWCEGSRDFLPGHNAQAHWVETEAQAAAAAGEAAEAEVTADAAAEAEPDA